jgi:hypothetical protein
MNDRYVYIYIRDTNSPDPDCTSFGLVCWSANLYEKLNKGGRPNQLSILGFEVDEVGISVGFDLAELLHLNSELCDHIKVCCIIRVFNDP